jgi:hypothetical protein
LGKQSKSRDLNEYCSDEGYTAGDVSIGDPKDEKKKKVVFDFTWLKFAKEKIDKIYEKLNEVSLRNKECINDS